MTPLGKARSKAMSPQKRFAVGARVVVKTPGVIGVITQADDEPTTLWEYWHTIKTEHGERREPGCNLELVPTPQTNSQPGAKESIRNIQLYGHNPRVNLNSTNNSTNIAYVSGDLFVQMNEKVNSIDDENTRKEILARLVELERTQGSGGFLEAYQKFIVSAANHMTLFAPFLPALAHMLSNAVR